MKHRLVDAAAAGSMRGRSTAGLPRPPAGAPRVREPLYLAYKRLIEAGPVSPLRDARYRRAPRWSTSGRTSGSSRCEFARWVGPGRARDRDRAGDGATHASLRRRVARAGLGGRGGVRPGGGRRSRRGDVRLAVNPLHPGRPPDRGHRGDRARGDGRRPRGRGRARGLAREDRRPGRGDGRARGRPARLIAAQRPALFIEVDDGHLRQFGSSAEVRLVRTVVESGYSPYRLTKRGVRRAGRSLPGRSLSSTRDGYSDLLFLPS